MGCKVEGKGRVDQTHVEPLREAVDAWVAGLLHDITNSVKISVHLQVPTMVALLCYTRASSLQSLIALGTQGHTHHIDLVTHYQ